MQVSTFSEGNKQVDCGVIVWEADKTVYELQCGYAIADQIKIELDDYLVLCEVEVYGEPGETDQSTFIFAFVFTFIKILNSLRDAELYGEPVLVC